MATLPQAVARHVEAAGLAGARLVAAVSGGPDSLALLHALHCLRDSHRLSLCVAHVDHGLRATSALDADFVRERAAALALPCTVVAVDVPRRPDGSFSEAAARDARYRALAGVAIREGAAVIATGHTADDQAETVLLHAVRGAGLAGLRAMSVLSDAPIDDGAGIRLFRPCWASGAARPRPTAASSASRPSTTRPTTMSGSPAICFAWKRCRCWSG